MGGYWARGRLKTASEPASVMTMDRTAAKMGRSMKNRANMVGSLRVGGSGELLAHGPGLDPGAVTDPLYAVHHHARLGRQPHWGLVLFFLVLVFRGRHDAEDLLAGVALSVGERVFFGLADLHVAAAGRT